MDWTLIQSFVAVAEAGSLSRAATRIGRSQPTLSRHITQLETALGTRVLTRSTAGVTLTDTGLNLMEHARTMADAAARMSMQQDAAATQGTVRLTASRIMATFVLPDVLTQVRKDYPQINIELVASDETNNLLRREADIAVRMYRPTQNDVITRHVGDMALAAYATPEYADSHAPITEPADVLKHQLVGYDRNPLIIDALRGNGVNISRDDFAFRSDDQVVCWQMVRAGFGLGFNQMAIGEADPRVVRMSGETPIGHIPVWLTAHPDLHSVPRVRRVFDGLRIGLQAVVSKP